MTVIFDIHELTGFNNRVLKEVIEDFPKESFSFVRKTAAIFRRQAMAEYKARTGKKTGNLRRGLIRGRAYKEKAAGRHPMGIAANRFAPDFQKMAEEFVDDLLKKGFY